MDDRSILEVELGRLTGGLSESCELKGGIHNDLAFGNKQMVQ